MKQRRKEVYGVALTGLQNLHFSKYLSNEIADGSIPAPNTISKKERTQIVLDWLKQITDTTPT